MSDPAGRFCFCFGVATGDETEHLLLFGSRSYFL
ncbi:MAG: hypothetical protein ACI9R3_000939 [Verrucomicrobiales bacterium]|jgi:hypothetical protein